MSVVVLAMFLALFGSTTVISAIEADNLAAQSNNRRVVLDSYSAQRGAILVEGTPIAYSEPSDDVYRFQRIYSEGEKYSGVTGYFTLNQGSTGLEGSLNQQLSGTANSQFFDQLNAIITGQEPTGASIATTLDAEAQQAAWDAMQGYEGAVVAIEPSTGRILALVSTPGFDPNPLASHTTSDVIEQYTALDEARPSPLQNRAYGGGQYSPGSTFKIIMTAAALENGYAPDSQFDNPATLTLPGTSTQINNPVVGQCGGGGDTVSMATALNLSCNIPYAELAQDLGVDTVADMAEAFGFNSSTQIPMTSTPSRYPRDIDEAQLMLTAFGMSSVRVNALQNAMVVAAVANDGVLMQPTLVDSVIAADLSVLDEFQPRELGRPISSATASTLNDMLVDGVSNGAAGGARIDGVAVGGKTGTGENGPGEPFNLWFSGFAPADDPQVAVSVIVGDGGGRGQQLSGNALAAPIARQVMEAVLNQ